MHRGPCGNGNGHDSRAQLERQRQAIGKLTDGRLHDLYAKLIKELPILIYSGDVDQCVPYYYSDNWVRNLGYPVTEEWRAWSYGDNDNQYVGGTTTARIHRTGCLVAHRVRAASRSFLVWAVCTVWCAQAM